MECTVEAFGFSGNLCDYGWNWTLQDRSSIVFHLLLWLAYAVSVKIVQVWVDSHKNYAPPTWLEPVKKFHNIALSAASGIMGFSLLYVVIMDGRFQSWHSMACQLTPNVGLYGFMNFLFLASKIWEWLDTYFLVLSGKPVIYLHWFHHMTTFTLMALTHNFPGGGYTFINCLIHLVMYAHYAHPLRWARPFITSTQLLQFVFMLCVHTYGYLHPDTCFDMAPVFYEGLFSQIVVLGFFVMFSLFFAEEYLQKRNRKAGNSRDKSRSKKSE